MDPVKITGWKKHGNMEAFNLKASLGKLNVCMTMTSYTQNTIDDYDYYSDNFR